MTVHVRVLGPTGVVGDQGPVELAARKPRSLLAALALDLGEVVTPDRLVDLMWGQGPPAGAFGTLHSYVSGLRRVLEPGLAPRARSTVLLSTDSGYRLALPREQLDATSFADAVRASHRELAPLASQLTTGPDASWPGRTRVVDLAEALEGGLAAWRGMAYADLPDHPDVLASRASLEEARASAEEDLVLALLALGEHATTVAMTEQAIARESFRERVWSLHALAQARAGRQADALDTIRRLTQLLGDELGLDPSPEVRALESAILRQEPAVLGGWLPPAGPAAPTSPPTRRPPAPSSGPARPDAVEATGLVGRDSELRTLDEVLDRAQAGEPAVALVVGEAGIGKSTLIRALAEEADARGFTVVSAPIREDNDAPPLWPWIRLVRAVADATGEQLVDLQDLTARPADERATTMEVAFEIREALAHAVVGPARRRALLVVFDDLHWADTPTLRALAHLVSEISAGTPGNGPRLAVVGTRRPVTDPPPALVDLEAVLARAGCTQVRLSGLDVASASALVHRVAGPGAVASAASWVDRTGGNPFFLVELARLAAGDPRWHGEVPTSVQQVVSRRLAELPETTREHLVLAAAIGGSFSPLALATVAGEDADVVQHHLDVAAAAGLVRDDADGGVRFEHALTRDAVLAVLPPGRLARIHARIAHAMAATPPETRAPETYSFELARHWLAAGPVHAPSAWRAAAEAADDAVALYAHGEATDLLLAAVDAHRLDPDGTRRERFELLVRLAGAAAAAARMPVVVDCTREATRLARAEDAPAEAARVVTFLVRYSLWTPIEWGLYDEDLVDDIRWALGRAARQDSRSRSVLMLTLATQLYYVGTARAEVEVLVDEGLALARRLDDPSLVAWAARAGHLALWRPEYLDRMVELATLELEAATAADSDEGRAFALTTLAALAMLRGDRDTHDAHMADALLLARRRRLAFALIGLFFVELSSAALRGEQENADSLHAELLRVAGSTAVAAQAFIPFGALLARGFWSPEMLVEHADEMVAIATTEEARANASLTTAAAMARLGRLDDVRTLRPLPPVPDDWGTAFAACQRAEVADALGDRTLAQEAVGALRDFRDGISLGGIAFSVGPTAGYLAMAENLLGNHAAAAEAADLAVRVAEQWGYTRYLEWFAQVRADRGF